MTTLDTLTSDGTQNVVLILDELDVSKSKVWYRVRLPILPNNSTGWVPRSALGTVTPVYTHLYVDRETKIATLKKNGRVIFTTRVGVGKPYWPTPPGQFYIRDKLTNFNNPFYGPIAFGTSARSAVLTDWPGGGFIGVHGTNEPELDPRVRSPTAASACATTSIVELARLMHVGTPLTITLDGSKRRGSRRGSCAASSRSGRRGSRDPGRVAGLRAGATRRRPSSRARHPRSGRRRCCRRRCPPFQFSATACGYQASWLPGRWIGGLTGLPSSHTRHQERLPAISRTANLCDAPAPTPAASSV